MLFQLILALRASLNAFFKKFYYYISLPYHYWRHNFDQGLLPQAMHNGLEPHLSKKFELTRLSALMLSSYAAFYR